MMQLLSFSSCLVHFTLVHCPIIHVGALSSLLSSPCPHAIHSASDMPPSTRFPFQFLYFYLVAVTQIALIFASFSLEAKPPGTAVRDYTYVV